jgi:hypothetical protein
MKITTAAILAAAALASAGTADAAGCIKGAAVGGVGGHFVGKGHAVLGAAAGCAVGHHRATVARRQAAAAPKK